MIIYVAGSLRLRTIFEKHEQRVGKFHRLDSFFYLKEKELRELRPRFHSFFLDSGAFSAWSKGEKIDLDVYIDFIKRNKNHLDAYATLDDISSPKKTEENTRYMERSGLHPVPVFHYNEPWAILEGLVAEYPYIALGGMVPISTKDLAIWLPECFKRICAPDGTPKIKVHGFGLTTISLVKQFPWYSVDSTSAVMSSAMGRILLPDGGDINLGKDGIPSKIERMYIEQRGYDVKGLTDDYILRQVFNIESIKMFQQKLTDSPPLFIFQQTSLL